MYDLENIKFDTAVIGAMLSTGWYNGYLGSSRKHSYYGNQELLLVQLVIDYKNGSRTIIGSDKTWKVTTGSELYSDILQGELFYEDRRLKNWMSRDYNDEHWENVVIKSLNNSVKIVAEAAPQVLMSYESVLPRDSWKIKPEVYVYDFGFNLVGYVSIPLYNYKGNGTIRIRHAEVLYPNGSIYTANLRSARATDTYVLNGKFFYDK